MIDYYRALYHETALKYLFRFNHIREGYAFMPVHPGDSGTVRRIFRELGIIDFASFTEPVDGLPNSECTIFYLKQEDINLVLLTRPILKDRVNVYLCDDYIKQRARYVPITSYQK